jgi:hypothetical protein
VHDQSDKESTCVVLIDKIDRTIPILFEMYEVRSRTICQGYFDIATKVDIAIPCCLFYCLG